MMNVRELEVREVHWPDDGVATKDGKGSLPNKGILYW